MSLVEMCEVARQWSLRLRRWTFGPVLLVAHLFSVLGCGSDTPEEQGSDSSPSVEQLAAARGLPPPVLPTETPRPTPAPCGPNVDPAVILACPEAPQRAWAEHPRDRSGEGGAQEALRRYDLISAGLSPKGQIHAVLRKGFILLRYGPGDARSQAQGLKWLAQARARAGVLGREGQCIEHLSYRYEADFWSRQTMEGIELPGEIFDLAVATVPRCLNNLHDQQAALATSLLLRSQYHRQRGNQLEQYRDLTRALGASTGATGADDLQRVQRIRFFLSELYHDLGDLSVAEEEYRELLEELAPDALELRIYTALALGCLQQDLGGVAGGATRQVRWSLAEAAFKTALELAEQQGREAEVLLAEAGLGSVALDRQELVRARALLGSLVIPTNLLPRQRHYLEHEKARLAIAEGHLELGRSQLEAIATDPKAEPERVWRALALLAELADRHPKPGLAPAHARYWQAIERIEAQREQLVSEVRDPRMWTLAHTSQRWEVYGRWLESLVDAWEQSGRRGSSQEPDPDWSAARSFTEAPINADVLLIAAEKRSSQSFTAALYRARGGLEGLAEHLLDDRMSALSLGGWISGQTLRQQLPEGLTVAFYQPLPRSGDLLLLQVTRQDVQAQRIPMDAALWSDLERLPALMNAQPAATPPALERVGERLLRPLEARLTDPTKPLAFVLGGRLERLPLAALKLESRFLVQRVVPFTLPNLSALRHLSRHPRPPGPLRALGVGFEVARAGEELALLEQPGFITQKLLGSEAQLERFSGALSGAHVVHLALHGASPGSVGNLSPKQAGSGGNIRPAQAGCGTVQGGVRSPACVKFADGALSARALSELPLDAHLLVLSACRTRLGAPEQPEEGVAGMARAGLVAGADAVIASSWAVGDDATYELMKRFYEYFPGRGRALALALAQRAMIGSSGSGLVVPRQLYLAPDGDETPVPTPVRSQRCEWPGLLRWGAVCPPPLETRALSAPWSWAGFGLIGGWD